MLPATDAAHHPRRRNHLRKPSHGVFLAVITAAMIIFGTSATHGEPPGNTTDQESRRRKPVRSLLEIRRNKVVIQQWDISCGAAALATVLTYQHGDRVGERHIAESMLKRTDPLRVKHRGGFSLLDLKRFAESRGYSADGYTEVGLEDLLEFGPAIVPVSISGYSHFVVFRGIIANRVFLADPAFGNRTLTIGQFEGAWLQNMAFVVTRRDGKPPPTELGPTETDFIAPDADTIRAAIRPAARP
jgi:predicted double-glycine peptidase